MNSYPIVLIHRWNYNSYYTTLNLSRPWINSDERVIHTSNISETGTSPLNVVQCHTKVAPYFLRWILFFCSGYSRRIISFEGRILIYYQDFQPWKQIGFFPQMKIHESISFPSYLFFKTSIYRYYFIYVFTHPVWTSRMWHRANLFAESYLLEFRVFLTQIQSLL